MNRHFSHFLWLKQKVLIKRSIKEVVMNLLRLDNYFFRRPFRTGGSQARICKIYDLGELKRTV